MPDEEFNQNTWRNWSNEIKANLKMKNNEIFKSLRKVLTGRQSGPEMTDLISILGREKIIERLKI